MKVKFRIFAGVLAVSILFCGCNIGNRKVVLTSGVSNGDVFNIGGDSCSVAEAKVYLANYQNIYGKSYGVDLWEQGFQKNKLKKYVKDVALSEMTKIVCMSLLAEEQGISLTDEEREKAKDAATEYYNSLSEAELEYTTATEQDITSMYIDYALANKVYKSLTKGVNEEVSDDEARIMEAMQIFVKTHNEVSVVKEKLAAGEDFAAVASNYNRKPTVEVTFGRGAMPLAVEEVAFELENEEVSSCISTDEGYYFIKCVNKFNEELTDANKSNIVEAREKAAFDDVYDEFVSGLTSSINETTWENIQLITDGSISTDNFFEIIEGAIN